MISYNKNKRSAGILGTFTIITLLCPLSVYSENRQVPPAKHLKIGSPIKKGNGTINIISGGFAEKKKNAGEELKKLIPKAGASLPKISEKHFKHIDINAKIDVAICPFNIGNDTLSAKHLAGSLRYYLLKQDMNPDAIDAVYNAGTRMNVDFGYMILSAMLESNFGSNTISPTSSARGIFQFIDSTWLILMNKYGDKIGLAEYADHISINKTSGKPEVSETDKITRESILNLRNDFKISSLIKAYHIKEEQDALRELGIKNPHATDYYIAHMLGVGSAKKLFELKSQESHTYLADSDNFRGAAENNPFFFYAREKTQPLTASQSYNRFYEHVLTAISRLRRIEDEHGIGKDVNLFRPPCKPAD